MSYHVGGYESPYDPEKPCNNHNPMNRRGGKTCRSRYTLTDRSWGETGRLELTGKSCLRFVDFHASQGRGTDVCREENRGELSLTEICGPTSSRLDLSQSGCRLQVRISPISDDEVPALKIERLGREPWRRRKQSVVQGRGRRSRLLFERKRPVKKRLRKSLAEQRKQALISRALPWTETSRS